MQDQRIASVLALSVLSVLSGAGCAHWGTTNVATWQAPTLPSATSTFLAPPRTPLASDALVVATKDPPPAGSTVLATSSVHCSYSGYGTCLQALLAETRRLGGNGLFGVHVESLPRAGSSLVGSVSFDPGFSLVAPSGRDVELRWKPRAEDPPLDVFLEQRQPDLVLRDPPDPWTVESWRQVCQLPCHASLDPDSSYRLVAPKLGNVPPLALKPSASDRVDLTTRQARPDYTNFWWGLALTLTAGGVVGGTLGYAATAHGPSSTAMLVVGLQVIPYFLYGVLELASGPERRIELATAPGG